MRSDESEIKRQKGKHRTTRKGEIKESTKKGGDVSIPFQTDMNLDRSETADLRGDSLHQRPVSAAAAGAAEVVEAGAS